MRCAICVLKPTQQRVPCGADASIERRSFCGVGCVCFWCVVLCGGACSTLLLLLRPHPLVPTRQPPRSQTHSHTHTHKRAHTLTRTQGPFHCGATIVREEGVRGLWSGASPTVMRNGLNQMCLFWAKNHMDRVRCCACGGRECAPPCWCVWRPVGVRLS